jgi:hypothetical protein
MRALILPRMGVTEGADLRAEGFLQLARFLEGGRLKNVVANLEYELASADRNEVEAATESAGMGGGSGESLFEAAVETRQPLGRISDLIHAMGVALALPIPSRTWGAERLANRPSLAAGNDPSRPFGVETDRRVMEFKFAAWLERSPEAGRLPTILSTSLPTSQADAPSSIASDRSQRGSCGRLPLRCHGHSIDRRSELGSCTKRSSAPSTRRFGEIDLETFAILLTARSLLLAGSGCSPRLRASSTGRSRPNSIPSGRIRCSGGRPRAGSRARAAPAVRGRREPPARPSVARCGSGCPCGCRGR